MKVSYGSVNQRAAHATQAFQNFDQRLDSIESFCGIIPKLTASGC